MSVARRSDGLISARQTLNLLGMIEVSAAATPMEQLLKDFAASHAGVWSRARNTIVLLCELGILEEDAGQVRVQPAFRRQGQDWAGVVGHEIAKSLASRVSKERRPGCLQVDKDGRFWLNSMLVPGAAEGIPLWIVEFAVATRESLGTHLWRIAKEHEALFRDGARQANGKCVTREFSAAELDDRLNANAEVGREAEEWVVQYEKARLSSHPFIDQVRRISEENVSAGFDIVSFSSETALYHDLFIEVKSFAEEKRFFWSRNEIAVAQALGEAYCLYLVDRTKIGAPGYRPQVIEGPHSALIASSGSGWRVSPYSYECVHLNASSSL